MNPQHTPGPWEIRDYELGLKAISAPNITHYLATGIDAADARLIAAAPELLAALTSAEKVLAQLQDHGAHIELSEARAALAKATGAA